RGFQGVVKRHGHSGGPASHGSKTGDLPGSVGASAYPSRVVKGRKLPGQMGDRRVTARNLEVIRVDTERNLVVLRGAVPGAMNGLVMVRLAGKGKRGE
ncbi:MAG: 50S ribosomal protein L3, partial [Candidatus Eisenbacteria bacterium]|nr:50S ribosomal protein L3 [Candidatus Latescibacterota bacterium]MBD3302759.1 50S ribosomal protein L3 [Candidatus Eisenbacteria bacterium]